MAGGDAAVVADAVGELLGVGVRMFAGPTVTSTGAEFAFPPAVATSLWSPATACQSSRA